MFSLNKQLSRHCKSLQNVIGEKEGPTARKRKKADSDNGGSGKATVGKGHSRKAKSSMAEPGKKKSESGGGGGGGGFTAAQHLSPELSELLGVSAASRGECMKLLWEYIKENNLQDPSNGTMILVSKDEKLHKVLQVETCRGFGMSKHLQCHFLGRAAME
jgi:upstream activation factor subunit UAF30